MTQLWNNNMKTLTVHRRFRTCILLILSSSRCSHLLENRAVNHHPPMILWYLLIWVIMCRIHVEWWSAERHMPMTIFRYNPKKIGVSIIMKQGNKICTATPGGWIEYRLTLDESRAPNNSFGVGIVPVPVSTRTRTRLFLVVDNNMYTGTTGSRSKIKIRRSSKQSWRHQIQLLRMTLKRGWNVM